MTDNDKLVIALYPRAILENILLVSHILHIFAYIYTLYIFAHTYIFCTYIHSPKSLRNNFASS